MRYSPKLRSWSEADLDQLRGSVHLPVQELASIFNVTPGAISQIKKRFGISRLVAFDPSGRAWAPIAEFPLWEVSDLGEVRNSIRKNRLKTHVDKNGYEAVVFKVEGKSNTRTVHRLVALAHVPPVEGKEEVNHKDGNKLRNCKGNLEWATEQENTVHAYATGLMSAPSGEAHWSRRDPERFQALVRGKLPGNGA